MQLNGELIDVAGDFSAFAFVSSGCGTVVSWPHFWQVNVIPAAERFATSAALQCWQ